MKHYQRLDRKVLVEESAATVAVAFEDEPVAVVANVASELTGAREDNDNCLRLASACPECACASVRTESSRGRRGQAAGGGTSACARSPSVWPPPPLPSRPRFLSAALPSSSTARASRARAAAPLSDAARSPASPHPAAVGAAARVCACSRCVAPASGAPGSLPSWSTLPTVNYILVRPYNANTSRLRVYRSNIAGNTNAPPSRPMNVHCTSKLAVILLIVVN